MKHWSTSTSGDMAEYSAFAGERDKKVSSFLHFSPQTDVSQPADRVINNEQNLNNNSVNNNANNNANSNNLSGLPFGVKDNIAVRNMPLTCGSKFLENFVSPYNATAIEKLIAAGAVVAGKTNLDEFGMGSSTDNSALAVTNNPWDTTRVCGGSSGGSAAAVAAGIVPFALGSDTGGSVRQPAAFCGVYGLKPTYGAVSRYGLVAYASSLECIGVLGESIGVTRDVFETIRGKDGLDHSSVDYRELAPEPKAVKKIGILTGDMGLSEEVAESYAKTIEELQAAGYELAEVEIPSLEYAVPAYYTIATAEASANLARFNGVRYGERPIYSENPDELVRKSRDMGFGDEVKLRILLGTYVLRSGFQDKYYHKAQAIRQEMRNEFDDVFGEVDVLMLPVFPVQAFAHGDESMDQFQQKVADRFTTAANLSGLPAMSCPTGEAGGLPTAVQFMAPAFAEDRLFSVAEKLADIFPYQRPADFSAGYSLD